MVTFFNIILFFCKLTDRQIELRIHKAHKQETRGKYSFLMWGRGGAVSVWGGGGVKENNPFKGEVYALHEQFAFTLLCWGGGGTVFSV